MGKPWDCWYLNFEKHAEVHCDDPFMQSRWISLGMRISLAKPSDWMKPPTRPSIWIKPPLGLQMAIYTPWFNVFGLRLPNAFGRTILLILKPWLLTQFSQPKKEDTLYRSSELSEIIFSSSVGFQSLYLHSRRCSPCFTFCWAPKARQPLSDHGPRSSQAQPEPRATGVAHQWSGAHQAGEPCRSRGDGGSRARAVPP